MGKAKKIKVSKSDIDRQKNLGDSIVDGESVRSHGRVKSRSRNDEDDEVCIKLHTLG